MTTTTATVTTLEVSVKVIRIGTKQCTQAVFRQLDKKPFYEGSGTVWGRVSYCPEGCRPGMWVGPCLNIVWSDGKNLYRDHFSSDLKDEANAYRKYADADLLLIAV